MPKYPIELKINGDKYSFEVEADLRLVDLLRNHLQLLGTKEACGKGECGACTVLMDGKSVASCLVLALQANGSEIITVEGLGGEAALHPLQQAFIQYGAVQCGFCTPGMLMSAKFLLDNNPRPSREEIRAGLAGNLCRCTGYTKIIDAIEAVVEGRLER
ncbi:MAG TPA: (2Fe-2S)-binding protein [Firmicutes bacterium]|jgi:carbon-monoxide dehydrogenase small subunit|nr:(2Fe-2S)-binding protein [Bacillota bacterium]